VKTKEKQRIKMDDENENAADTINYDASNALLRE